MSDKEKVLQILTKYTMSEFVEYHIEAVDRINKAIEYMENYIEVEEAPINERIKIEFKCVLDILRGVE